MIFTIARVLSKIFNGGGGGLEEGGVWGNKGKVVKMKGCISSSRGWEWDRKLSPHKLSADLRY